MFIVSIVLKSNLILFKFKLGKKFDLSIFVAPIESDFNF